MDDQDVQRISDDVAALTRHLARGLAADEQDEVRQEALIASWRRLDRTPGDILTDRRRLRRYLWTVVARERNRFLAGRPYARAEVPDDQPGEPFDPATLADAWDIVELLRARLPIGSAGRDVLEAFIEPRSGVARLRFVQGLREVRTELRVAFRDDEMMQVYADLRAAIRCLSFPPDPRE